MPLFRKTLKVDLGELVDENESLSVFLHKTCGANATSEGHDLLVDPGGISAEKLKEYVNKFIYHRSLNNSYWVSLEHGIVKIHEFEGKKEKKKKKTTVPSTIKHGW